MTIIYKKVGRRYVAIGSCDPEQTYYPHGSHLVVCKKGSTLTKFDIAPDFAAVEAALVLLKDAMSDAMRKATEMKLEKRPYTKKELAGIAAYQAIAGSPISLRYEGVSMNDVIQAGVSLVRKELSK